MSGKSLIRSTVVALSMLTVLMVLPSAPAFAAPDATIDQVYAAAKAGKIDEAQTMMQQILQDHPKSARAHFVEAELLVRQGLFSSAQAELATADRLAPGLPFAKPAAVEGLRNRIAHPSQQSAIAHPVSQVNSGAMTTSSYTQAPAPQPSSGGGSGSLLWILLALGVFIFLAMRFMSNRATQVIVPMNGGGMPYSGGGVPGFGGGVPMQTYGGGVGPMMGGQAGGLGSGIIGGLATGAAVGAGMVAGEALMHHFTDPDRSSRESSGYRDDMRTDGRNDVRNDVAPPNDMGGNDFGIIDSSSWDDASGSSSDSGGGGDWDS